MLFSKQELTTMFSHYKGNALIEVSNVMTDSRKPMRNALFVPIVGEKFDGHDFLLQAIENGAVAALWKETKEIPDQIPESFVFFFVTDTLTAFQQLACYYRDTINPIVIGVTGSNGKTTTKDLLSAVMQTSYRTYATKGNFNNHIGLPLTILEMPRDTEVLILEMGMNHLGEIDVLTKIAKPNYAIITNIGESHIEHLGSRKGIAQAKLEILHGLHEDGMLIIDGDEPLLEPIHAKPYTVTCGFSSHNDIALTSIRINGRETSFQVDNELYSIPLLGRHHAKNASYAMIVGKELGITDERIRQGLQSIEYSKMRFEWVTGKNNVSLINDAYNASPTSMKAAIEVVKQLDTYKKKIVVLGDILELGKHANSFHLEVAKVIDSTIDMVITYGIHARTISEYVSKHAINVHSVHCETKEEIATILQSYFKEDTVILFKASRAIAFEELIDQIKA